MFASVGAVEDDNQRFRRGNRGFYPVDACITLY
jgi:hypothetical protein